MLKPALAIFSMVASCKLPFGRPNLNFLLMQYFPNRVNLPTPAWKSQLFHPGQGGRIRMRPVRAPLRVRHGQSPGRSSTFVVAVQSRDDFGLVWSNILEMSQNEARSN
jgi:hypothetical protein